MTKARTIAAPERLPMSLIASPDRAFAPGDYPPGLPRVLARFIRLGTLDMQSVRGAFAPAFLAAGIGLWLSVRAVAGGLAASASLLVLFGSLGIERYLATGMADSWCAIPALAGIALAVGGILRRD